MKIMKKILMVLMVLSMIVVFVGPASAAWYIANVEFAKIDDAGVVHIRVQRETGYSKTFAAPTGLEKQYLSMALCAQSAGLQIKINVNWAVALSDIEGLMVLSPTP